MTLLSFPVSTTGSDVDLFDLGGGVILNHPSTNYDLLQIGTETEVKRSQAVQDAIANGELTTNGIIRNELLKFETGDRSWAITCFIDSAVTEGNLYMTGPSFERLDRLPYVTAVAATIYAIAIDSQGTDLFTIRLSTSAWTKDFSSSVPLLSGLSLDLPVGTSLIAQFREDVLPVNNPVIRIFMREAIA